MIRTAFGLVLFLVAGCTNNESGNPSFLRRMIDQLDYEQTQSDQGMNGDTSSSGGNNEFDFEAFKKVVDDSNGAFRLGSCSPGEKLNGATEKEYPGFNNDDPPTPNVFCMGKVIGGARVLRPVSAGSDWLKFLYNDGALADGQNSASCTMAAFNEYKDSPLITREEHSFSAFPIVQFKRHSGSPLADLIGMTTEAHGSTYDLLFIPCFAPIKEKECSKCDQIEDRLDQLLPGNNSANKRVFGMAETAPSGPEEAANAPLSEAEQFEHDLNICYQIGKMPWENESEPGLSPDTAFNCRDFSKWFIKCMQKLGHDAVWGLDMYCKDCKDGKHHGHRIVVYQKPDGRFCPGEPQNELDPNKPGDKHGELTQCCSEDFEAAKSCAVGNHCKPRTNSYQCCTPSSAAYLEPEYCEKEKCRFQIDMNQCTFENFPSYPVGEGYPVPQPPTPKAGLPNDCAQAMDRCLSGDGKTCKDCRWATIPECGGKKPPPPKSKNPCIAALQDCMAGNAANGYKPVTCLWCAKYQSKVKDACKQENEETHSHHRERYCNGNELNIPDGGDNYDDQYNQGQ